MSYQHIEPFTKLITPRGIDPDISDPVAILVDTKIARMGVKHELAAEVVGLYFYTGWSCQRLADEMRRTLKKEINRRQIAEFVNIGVAWFDGFFEELA